MEPKKCPKCEATMKRGDLYSEPGPIIRHVVRWAAFLDSKDTADVKAHRCPECGFIEIWSKPDTTSD